MPIGKPVAEKTERSAPVFFMRDSDQPLAEVTSR
jgi:hypothetical protein